jgi:hypothetical protein
LRRSSVSGCGEFFISGSEDRLLAAGQLVGGRHVADGRVQADAIIVFDEVGDEPARFVQGQRHGRSEAVSFERAVALISFPT